MAYLPKFVVESHNADVVAKCRLSELKSPVAQKDRPQSVFIVQRKDARETDLQQKVAKCLRSLK